MCKWTHTVQTHVVQGSTVYKNHQKKTVHVLMERKSTWLLMLSPYCKIYMEM